MRSRLELQLYSDLEEVGLPTDFLLTLQEIHDPVNYGYYNINDKEIIIPILDNNLDEMSYKKLLEVAIHEAIHHYQWTKVPYFKRVKGVMHNEEFKTLFNHFTEVANVKIFGGAKSA